VLALVAAAMLAAGCRNKDPYADFKPAQLQDEGERLLRTGDLANAEKLLRLGLERAERNSVKLERLRPAFLVPLFHLAVKRGDEKEAARLYERMGAPIDVRAAFEMMIFATRTATPDEARAKGEVVAQAMEAKKAEDPDERAIYVAAWITIDRLRSARFDRAAAREASDAVAAGLTDLAEMRGSYRPLPPGLRAWVSRYIDHLFATDRPDAAREVASLIERIDENAPPPPSDALCLPLFRQWQNLGCLLE
jgi:hypothetical protein